MTFHISRSAKFVWAKGMGRLLGSARAGGGYSMWFVALVGWCLLAGVVAVRFGRLTQRGAARATDADHIRVVSRRLARGHVA